MNSETGKSGFWTRFSAWGKSSNDRRILRILEGYIPAIESLPPDDIAFCINAVRRDPGNLLLLFAVLSVVNGSILWALSFIPKDIGSLIYAGFSGCEMYAFTLVRLHRAAKRVVALLHARLPSTICGCGYYLTEGLQQCPECGASIRSGGRERGS
jgi:hypothetical protein